MARPRKARRATPAAGVIYDLDERRRRVRTRNEDGSDSPDEQPPEEERKERETPEERERRIADLKQRIASGTYKPDPEEIARKIIERGF